MNFRMANALAALLLALSASAASAVSFNQVASVDPGDVGVSIDVDLGSTSDEFVGFKMSFETGVQPLFFYSALDNPADGGAAPIYQLFEQTPGAPTSLGSGFGGVSAPSPSFTGAYLLVATSSNLPTDNLSKFRLNFLLSPSITAGVYRIPFASEIETRDANGVVSTQVNVTRGEIPVTVGMAPIPLPAGALLLLTGLASILCLRRRAYRA